MATPTGVAGSRVWVTDAAIASTIDSEAEFFAQNWTEISLVENIGELGRMFETVPFVDIAGGRTYKLKGAYNDGGFDLTVAEDLADSGQSILAAAADDMDQDNYGFRIEQNDPPSSLGGPTTWFFRGLPMAYTTRMGNAGDALLAASHIEINSDIIHVPPAELYDRFNTGGSLTHYELFKGSDAQATLPVISSGTLQLASGDTGTSSFAADGSQAIGDDGYTLASGALVIEARVKLSDLAAACFFFGLTDQKAALEIPIESAGASNNITTNASDAVGFMYDRRMSSFDKVWLVGVNNDVDEAAQNTNQALVAATYATLRISINTSGDATFYINGVQVGSTMTTACRTNVALYPTVCVSNVSVAAQRTLNVDYLYLRQD